MGIVKRQGLQSSVVIYAGFLLGAVNLLILFPKYLSPEQIGLTRILFGFSSVFVQFAMLGVPSIMLKFYPYYKDNLSKKANDFLFLSIIISLIGFIVFASVAWMIEDKIKAVYVKHSPLFVDFFYLVYAFSFFILFYTIIETYAKNNLESVIGNFVREVGFRIYTAFLLILFAFSFIDFDLFVKIYIASHFLGTIAVVIYLWRYKKIYWGVSISKVTSRLYKKMISYGSFIYGAGFILILAGSIDTLFIAGMKGLESTAVFSIACYIAAIIQVPQRSTANILMPVLAQAWKDKNMPLIESLYKKTAINQMVFGIFLFLIIWINADSIFILMPNGHLYQEGKYVILIMCFTKLIDMSAGSNSEILITSNFWRFNFLTIVILVALSIPANYFFIQQYGIIGSAYSNLLAYSVYNSARFLFIWWKFQLQPFSFKTFLCFTIAVVSYMIIAILPSIQNTYYDVLFRSMIIIITYSTLILFFRVSGDVNTLFAQILNKGLTLFRKHIN